VSASFMVRLKSGLRSMRSVHGEIDIAAPPERVWEVFTDFQSFPSWNPFISKLTGELMPGQKLEVVLRMGWYKMRFRPTVTVVKRPQEIRWLARQFLPGLLDIERSFEFQPKGDSGTHFAQSEVGSGLTAPIVMPIMHRQLEKGYAALNGALKARAEGSERQGVR
jgi:hypothetical protein